MHLLSTCEEGDVLKVIHIILIIINIIKILVPMILIVVSIKDLFKAVIENEEKKIENTISSLIKRLIIGVTIFFIPTLIYSVTNLVLKKPNNFQKCIDNATEEGIERAYYNKVLKMVDQAKNDIDGAKLKNALSFANNKIKDSNKLSQIEKEIAKIQEYVDISNEIHKMTKKEQYTDLRNKVASIPDNNIKAQLFDKLENKYRIILEEERIAQESKKSIEQDSSGFVNVDINGQIVIQEQTETLKIVIQKVNSYYITRIWVDDPYNQLNKYDSPKYGQQLYRPSKLLETVISEKGLSNKLLVGFNASGFYLKDTYDSASVNYYPAYDKTSVGTLVITDGKVVRNAYTKACKTWYIAGVNKNGYLNIYTDSKTSDASVKKKWSESVIGEIRNTFTFASPLVVNGIASNETTSMPSVKSNGKRQAICQIDKNNFMLITGSDLSRQNLIDIMLKAKCQTGTNLDGGGSIALLLKKKNSNNIETIIGNNRSLTEVGFFSE